MSDTPKRDYRQEVTNDIIRLLEQGVAPWQKPWTAQHSISIPFNPTTSKPYRGGNILVLTVAAMRRGYDDPRWATYRQASNEGWQVRRGEKGTQIEFWDVKPPGRKLRKGATSRILARVSVSSTACTPYLTRSRWTAHHRFMYSGQRVSKS